MELRSIGFDCIVTHRNDCCVI